MPLVTKRIVPFVATTAVAAAVVIGASACTPDTTRARVEHDVPETFANSYAFSEQLQGKPAVRPHVTSTECHSSVNAEQDSGPGAWNCDLAYTVGDESEKKSLLVLIDQLGCYQATDTDHRDATITDKATGALLPDPKVGFDGCYDVYDDRTSVSKN
jgi:hypothetical protein